MGAEKIILDVVEHDLPLREPFAISGYVFTKTPVVTVTAHQAGITGIGETAGVYYMDDTPAKAAATLRALAVAMPDDLDREMLRSILPAGGARNALDCALWEVEARRAGKPVWALAGLDGVRPLLTTITVGVAAPEAMAQSARGFDYARAIKLKLSGDADLDIERVRLVRAARPDVWLGVDANQGYTAATIGALIPVLVDNRVSLLEQPFRRGAEAQLDGLSLPLPVAADESCLDLAELESLPGRFDVVNIKLDKCGGLTEGLMIARRAKELGLKVMVGNMMGSSVATAPAFVVGQLCDVVDLDGPVMLDNEPPPTVNYADGLVHVPDEIWGPARH